MPRGYAPRGRTAAVILTVSLVAGAAGVRGGVDLLFVVIGVPVAAAALALACRPEQGELPVAPLLSIGLGGALVAIAMQLVPLPPSFVRTLSPASAAILADSLGPVGRWPSWRPLSLDPGSTGLELAKAAIFTAVAAAGALLGASKRRQDQLLRGLALSGTVVATAHYLTALLGVSTLVEPRVTFVNPNHLAGFLQLAAWPALGFALRARGPARTGWILAFAITASAVFLSLSRAGIVAFFVALGVFAALRTWSATNELGPPCPHAARPALPRAAPKGRSRGRSAFALGLATALAIAAWLAFDPIVSELRSVSNESTVDTKLGLWPGAIGIVREFPLTGIGRGAFATVYPAYKSEPLQKTFTHVENEWLQLPVELGVLVGGAVIMLFVWAFMAAGRRRDVSRPLAGALAGAAAVAVQNLFDFGLEIPGVAIPFALVLGLASRDMRRVEVRPWIVRSAAGALLLLGSAGLVVYWRHPTDADAHRVVAASTADDAVAIAREVLPSHPADYVPHAAVGAKLAAEDRCREALAWLTRAMRRNPTAPEPHRAMAGCLARSGQHALAKREYRLAFAFGDATALVEADRYYRAPGELLEIAPDTPEGLLAAARVLRDHPREAAEALRRAWESFGDSSALASLASAKLALGEQGEALQLAHRLQAVAPQHSAGYVQAALALEALGRPDEALGELELGAARLPGHPDVLVPLGDRHLQKRRYSQAKAVFEAIVAEEGPAQVRKRILVARALERQGRYREALREAQVAREIAGGDVAALEAFARLAAEVGRYDEAIDALEVAARTPAAKPGAYDVRLSELRAARDEQRLRVEAQDASRWP
ncbi:MAG TPA: O-antigen ligase family protein [Anaeromyxobacter sp.]|nr:O-antigen ligase family protein [Anaeromyxobacter sp.]